MNEPSDSLAQPIYFVTLNVAGSKHLFANEACVRLVFDALDWSCRRGKLALFAFALVPSHFCMLCRPLAGGINRLVGDFADYTGSRMAVTLQRRGRGPLVHYLHERTSAGGGAATVWSEPVLREIRVAAEIRRVLEFIHDKPARDPWRLASPRGEYPYSSACFYDLGREPVIPVTDVRLEAGMLVE